MQDNLIRTDVPKNSLTFGGKWLIHGREHHKDNQSQSLKRPGRIS